MPLLRHLVHQLRQARRLQGGRQCHRGRVGGRRLVRQQMLQGVQPDQIEGLELDLIARQVAQGRGQVGQRGRFACVDGGRQRVVRTFALWHQPVDHQMLARQADGRQLVACAGRFTQGTTLGACHQHQSGAQRVGQRIHRRLVRHALLFEPGQWAETRGIAFAGFQKTAPRARQLQQADGVAGGGRVKHDVIEVSGQGRVQQQAGELVEGGDFGGAGPRELLLDAFHHGVRQHPSHRPDDAIAVELRSGLRVDLQRGQTLDRRNGRDVVADLDAEHLPDVGRRVGAHQQHAAPGLGQSHGRGAGQRGLAHAAFAGEKEEARCVVQKQHG